MDRPEAFRRAREARKKLTPQEAGLWKQLKALRGDGYHWRCQAPLLNFVLDFVCFSRRLIVEVDGAQHREDERQQDHDAMRDAVLARRGFLTLRFTNAKVSGDMAGVMTEILEALENRSSPSENVG